MRVIIFAPNWLGDAVMALPAIADAHRAWPEAYLAVAARGPVAPLFEAVSIVDEVIALDGRGRFGDRARVEADVRRLRAGRFDAALLLPNSFAAAYLARRAGVPERWGYRGDFRRLLLTRAVARPSPRGHQAEYYQELVQRLRPARGAGAPNAAAALGWPAGGKRGEAEPPSARAWGEAPLSTWREEASGQVDLKRAGGAFPAEGPTRTEKCLPGSGLQASGFGPDGAPFVRPSPAAADRARDLLSARGWHPDASLVGIAPGAAYGHAKRWPPAHYAAAMRALAADGVQLVVVGSAGDLDSVREIEHVLSTDASRIAWIDLAGRTDLATLIGVLASCRALVSNDSGAMHLAAAIGVPVTAMFGPTDERTTSPLPMGGGTARAHAVLATAVRCRPCLLRECPIDHRCMTRILPEEVVAQVRRQLA